MHNYPNATTNTIIDRVAAATGQSKLTAELFVRATLEAIRAELVSPFNTAGAVKFRDFFTISRHVRNGKIPGQETMKTYISFRLSASKALREEVYENLAVAFTDEDEE